MPGPQKFDFIGYVTMSNNLTYEGVEAFYNEVVSAGPIEGIPAIENFIRTGWETIGPTHWDILTTIYEADPKVEGKGLFFYIADMYTLHTKGAGQTDAKIGDLTKTNVWVVYGIDNDKISTMDANYNPPENLGPATEFPALKGLYKDLMK